MWHGESWCRLLMKFCSCTSDSGGFWSQARYCSLWTAIQAQKDQKEGMVCWNIARTVWILGFSSHAMETHPFCTMVAMVSSSVHSVRVVLTVQLRSMFGSELRSPQFNTFARSLQTLFLCVSYVSLSTSATVVWSSFRHPSIATSITDDQWIKWINVLIDMTLCSYWCVIYIYIIYDLYNMYIQYMYTSMWFILCWSVVSGARPHPPFGLSSLSQRSSFAGPGAGDLCPGQGPGAEKSMDDLDEAWWSFGEC